MEQMARKEDDKHIKKHRKDKEEHEDNSKLVHLKKNYDKGCHPIRLVGAEFGSALLVGKPGSGKSYLSQWLTLWMSEFFDFVISSSPTAGLNGNYDYMHPKLTHKVYTDTFFEDILNFMENQTTTAKEQGKEPPSLLLDLDDITGFIPFNSPVWKQFIIIYSHYRITLKILVQCLTEVPTLTRNCITDYFIFPHQLSEQNMRGLWKTMGTECWDDWESFMDEHRTLKPHQFLYFQRRDKDRKERYQIMIAPPKEKIPNFCTEPDSDSSSEEESDEHEFPHLHSDKELPEEIEKIE